MKNTLICLFLLCLWTSCKAPNDLDPTPREFDQNMTLIPTDTLTIPIGYRSNVYSNYIRSFRINKVPYLGVVNENTNELECYALSGLGKNFKVRFQVEGPNGVGQLKAFEVISDSTLLIASTYRIRLYVTDFEGSIKSIIKTDEVERKDKPFVQIYYSNQPVVFDRNKQDAFLFTRVDADFNSPGIWSGTMFLKASTINEGSINHIFKLPSHFDKYIHGSHFCHGSHLLMENRYLILSNSFYNNLLIYDLEKGEMIEREGGSKYFGDVFPMESPKSTSDGHEEFYITSNSYRELAYDEENKLLYRLAYRGVDYIGPDGQRRNWDNKQPSVIIINSNFEKVGEIDLPVNTIYTWMYFTLNGKLYLSLNHPDNNPSEDEMVFVGYKPEKL